MIILKLTTERQLTQSQYEEYKKLTPLLIDWEKLEQTGKEQYTQNVTGEKVVTHISYTILPTKD